MPAKPSWFGRLDSIIQHLNSLPYPWVDRQTLQTLLNVGPRRTQQILEPCISHQLGTNGLARRDQLIAHLRLLAGSPAAGEEKRRQHRFVHQLDSWRKDWLHQPKLHVEAPSQVLTQQLGNLPSGVDLGPGTLSVRFDNPQEALEKLLALAMAIGNDYERFERMTAPASGAGKRINREVT
ncbi:MAG TPA: hypothetical protein VM120_23115 [Bryobacteraceae bacterium]|nr:hypothetical protein [Bryobacteraceae bacterium]